MWKNTITWNARLIWLAMLAAGVLAFVGAFKATELRGTLLFAVVGCLFIGLTIFRCYSWWNYERKFIFKTGFGGVLAVEEEVQPYWTPAALVQVQKAVADTCTFWQQQYLGGGAELISPGLKSQYIVVMGKPYTGLGDKRRGSTDGGHCILVWQPGEPLSLLYEITCHETGHVCLNSMGILNEGESHHELMRHAGFNP